MDGLYRQARFDRWLTSAGSRRARHGERTLLLFAYVTRLVIFAALMAATLYFMVVSLWAAALVVFAIATLEFPHAPNGGWRGPCPRCGRFIAVRVPKRKVGDFACPNCQSRVSLEGGYFRVPR